jgi:hypothetical protein
MSLKDFFSWAGFTGIGGGISAATNGGEDVPIWGDMSSAAGTKSSGYSLSFGTKFLIASGLTVIGLYTVRRLLK